MGQLRVYGVDDRFWRFHGVADISGPQDRDVFVSRRARARDGSRGGEHGSAAHPAPIGDPARIASRAQGRSRSNYPPDRSSGRPPPSQLGDFSLEAQQGDVRALFVPLARLQGELAIEGRVNALLVSRSPGTSGDARAALEQS